MADDTRASLEVSDVMTKDPVAIGADAPLREAADLMRSRGIRHLPVLDGAGHLLGIVTDRDLVHAAFVPLLADYLAWDPHRLKAPRVRDVMTWSVVTTSPHVPLVQAGLKMFQRRIGSLPVVDGDRLIGMLTERDVVRAFREAQGLDSLADAFLW